MPHPIAAASPDRHVEGSQTPKDVADRQAEVIDEIARWCQSAQVEPMAGGSVPGASDEELKHLAALGHVAYALRGIATKDRLALPAGVRSWLRPGGRPPEQWIDALRELVDDRIDPLAAIYERLVSGMSRRGLGTFFTPPQMVDYMRQLLARNKERPANVIDPGAGVGAFSIAAQRWRPDASVHAVDVNVVTLGLLAARSHFDRSRCKFVHDDFLEWLSERWPKLEGPRLILGNPPYTRHQLLSARRKYLAGLACGELMPGQRAGLSTYFLAASLVALGEHDSLCLLLPSNWLEADYAKSIRDYLWRRHWRRVELHLLHNHHSLFPDVQVGAMVLYVGKHRERRQPLLAYEVTTRGQQLVGSKVDPLDRGSRPPAAFTLAGLSGLAHVPTMSGSTVALAELVTVRRGVATGANAFFLRTEAEKSLLPAEATIKAIGRLRDLGSLVFDDAAHEKMSVDGLRCWLLAITHELANVPSVAALLAQGEASGVPRQHLCQARSVWYIVERIAAPHVLISPMGKEIFRVVVNEAGAIPTNTLYGLKLRSPRAPGGVLTLTSWLASDEGQAELRRAARQQGSGLLKLEPRALGGVRIPRRVSDTIALSSTT